MQQMADVMANAPGPLHLRLMQSALPNEDDADAGSDDSSDEQADGGDQSLDDEDDRDEGDVEDDGASDDVKSSESEHQVVSENRSTGR